MIDKEFINFFEYMATMYSPESISITFKRPIDKYTFTNDLKHFLDTFNLSFLENIPKSGVQDNTLCGIKLFIQIKGD